MIGGKFAINYGLIGSNAYRCCKLLSCSERFLASLLIMHSWVLIIISWVLQYTKILTPPYTPATTLQLPMNQPITGGRTPATFVILLPPGHNVHCPAHTRDSVVWRRSSACRLPLTCGGGDRRWTSLVGTGTRSRGG